MCLISGGHGIILSEDTPDFEHSSCEKYKQVLKCTVYFKEIWFCMFIQFLRIYHFIPNKLLKNNVMHN